MGFVMSQKKANDFDYEALGRRVLSELPSIYRIFLGHVAHQTNALYLNRRLLVVATTNATSDIQRSANYHSQTGPSDWKVAAFYGKWVAHHRPIQSTDSYPINLLNAKIVEVNSHFAAFVVQALLTPRIYPKLFADLRYCLEFRDMSGDSLALLLQHALKYSPQGHSNSA